MQIPIRELWGGTERERASLTSSRVLPGPQGQGPDSHTWGAFKTSDAGLHPTNEIRISESRTVASVVLKLSMYFSPRLSSWLGGGGES